MIIVTAEFVPDFDMYSEHFRALYTVVDSERVRLLLEREPSLYTILSENSAPVYERYGNYELAVTPEKAKEQHYKIKKQYDDVEHNRLVKIKYHWNG